MGRQDAEVLKLFKQCLDLQPSQQEALLASHTDLAPAVRQMLAADDNLRPVEDGFGVGALNLLVATQDAQADDILPTAIGPYRVLRMAGSGATAIVYEAMEAVPRRRVAVKVARATLDPDHHNRFQAEAEALSKIRHQAVPVVFRVGQIAGLPWLAVEWVEGEALGEEPTAWTLQDLALVADGLHAAHQQDVFHGDISPGNLLRTASGPKIVDFGHAQVTGQQASTGGTPGFMGPDALTGPRRDQFAMARVIALCCPNAGRLLAAVIDAATHAQYGSLADLALDLRAVADDLPISVVPQTPLEMTRRSLRKHRRRWTLIGGAVLCAMALVAGYWKLQSMRVAQAQTAHADEARADLTVALTDAHTAQAKRRALQEWLSNPRWYGTPAISTAWLELATLQHDGRQLQAATESAGRAVVHAKTSEQRQRAAQTLASLFTVQGRWSPLQRLAEQLPGEHADAWALRVAVATRDIARGLELTEDDDIRTLLTQWQECTRTEHRAALAKTQPNGVLIVDQLAERLVLAPAEPALPVVYSERIPGNHITGFADRDLFVMADEDASQVLYRLTIDGSRIVTDVVDRNLVGMLTASRFDESEDRAIVGFGPPRRTIAWSGSPDSSFHDTTTAARSDVSNLLHLRKSDGSERMVAALGPWSAYDLRLFEPGPSGEPVLLDRLELGTCEGLSTYTDSGHPMLVVPKSDHYPNRAVFGDAHPAGWPMGVYTFDLHADRFEQVGFVPFDRVVPSGSDLTGSMAGDIDGDGDIDIVLRVGVPNKTRMLVLLTTDSGVERLMFDDIHPLALVNVDDDPAMEVIVRLNDDDYATWVVGAGTQSLPVRTLEHTSPLSDEPPAEVAALSQLGLDRPAALTAESLAARSAPAERAQLLTTAANSWLRFSDTKRAIQALHDAMPHAHPDDEPAIRRMLTTLLLRDLRPAEAMEVARQLDPMDWPEALASSTSMPVWKWAPDWQHWDLHAIDSIRTPMSASSAVLELDNTAGLVASTELDWEQDELLIQYRLGLSELELGSGFEARIVRGGERWVSADVVSFGGGNDLSAISRCWSLQGQLGHLWPIVQPPTLENRVEITLRLNQVTGTMVCQLRLDDELVRSSTITTVPPPGSDTRLELHSTAVTTDAMTRAVVTLQDLEIRGAQPVFRTSTPLDEAHRLLIAGEYDHAAEAYTALQREDLAALARLDGGDTAAATWFGAHPNHPLTRRLHRARVEVGQALFSSDSTQYAQHIVRDLGSASRYIGSADVRALLLHPSLAELPITDASSCDVLRWRAKAYAFEGRDGAALSTLARVASSPTTPALERCQVGSYLDAASLLSVAGRVDEARARVQEAVDRSSTPDLVQSRASRRPDLESLYPP